jgi:hypothetical protein
MGAAELYIIDNPDMNLLKIRNNNNQNISIDKSDGLIINTWISHKYNISKGDNIVINTDGKKYQLTVSQISDGVFGNIVYCNFEYAVGKRLINEKSYNGILTNIEINNNELFTMTTSSIEESINSSNSIYFISAIICLLCGLAIGIPLLILSFMNVVNSSKGNLVILRINGYTTSETNRLILSPYRFFTYIGLLISVPYTYLVGTIMFGVISKVSTMMFSLYINIFSISGTILITVIIVELFLFNFRNSIKKLSHRTLIES